MNVAVLGSSGQLGMELCRQLGDAATALDQDQVDITCREAVCRVLQELKPTAVINAAAFTDVDGAEEQPDLCFAVNAGAVAHLVAACSDLLCPLVQISTDYVFGCETPPAAPHGEEDPPFPRGVYARSKWEGERHAAKYQRSCIIRTCGLYGQPGPRTTKRNFVDTMLWLGRRKNQLRIVNDQVCTPTYVPHCARAMLFLMQTASYGMYHVTNQGSTNWADFAAEIFRQCEMQVEIVPISTEEYGAAAPRPRYSVLDTHKYHALGGPVMPTWREALSEHLQSRPQ